MIRLEIQHRRGRRGTAWHLLYPRSPGQCYEFALRVLRWTRVVRCRCRNGGFVTEIDRNGYRTRRDTSIGVGD